MRPRMSTGRCHGDPGYYRDIDEGEAVAGDAFGADTVDAKGGRRRNSDGTAELATGIGRDRSHQHARACARGTIENHLHTLRRTKATSGHQHRRSWYRCGG